LASACFFAPLEIVLCVFSILSQVRSEVREITNDYWKNSRAPRYPYAKRRGTDANVAPHDVLEIWDAMNAVVELGAGSRESIFDGLRSSLFPLPTANPRLLQFRRA